MYKFVDTTEVSVGTLMPSEALMLNGEYIENLVQGYRTLTVSGREALSPELNVHDTVTRDGSILKSRRYPARTIKIQYQLVAENAEAYRAAYNQLAKVLDVENAQLIFNDEPDKYFTGTVSYIGEVEAGRNCVVGEFEFYCADPFKYSVNEYEVEAQDVAITDENGETIVNKMFVVDYNGTYKAFPTITTEFYKETGELTGNGDCGYVAFINNDGSIVQVGDPEEVDGETTDPSQTLIYDEFDTLSTSWKAGQALSRANYEAGGSIKVAGSALMPDRYFYVSNVLAKYWGASAAHAIPTDKNGKAGATDFTLTFDFSLVGSNTSSSKRYGSMRMSLITGTGDNREAIAYVDAVTLATGSTTVSCCAQSTTANLYTHSSANKVSGTTVVTKEGNTITFNFDGSTKSFVCEGLENVAVTEICFEFYQSGSTSAPTTNKIGMVKFVKHNCDNWLNIPNKFSTGDILTVDCRKAELAVNGLRSPEYGALGNDWEKFFLKSGLNNISIAYSDWLTGEYVPTFKMRYREVFL